MWAEQHPESENSDDVDLDMLKTSLKAVRGRKEILKHQHKMKAKLRARPKNMKLSEMADSMQAKGIDVTKDALRARSKSRRTLNSLEEA